MSRHAKVKVKLCPFVPVFLAEMDSPAFHQLSGNSAKLYVYLKRSCSRAAGNKPANEVTVFGFSYTEAERYGFARRTFIRMIKELIEAGFIELVEKGGLRGCNGVCSKYRLSRVWASRDMQAELRQAGIRQAARAEKGR